VAQLMGLEEHNDMTPLENPTTKTLSSSLLTTTKSNAQEHLSGEVFPELSKATVVTPLIDR